MGNLSEKQAALPTKIVGADSAGAETNVVGADAQGNLYTRIAGVLDDSATAAVAEDASASVRITPKRALHSNLRDVAGAEIGVSANPLYAKYVNLSSILTITALDVATTTLVGANSQSFYFGTPTANSEARFALNGVETALVQGGLLGAGGTLVVEASSDGGTTWHRPVVFQPGTQTYSNSFTAPFLALVNTAGFTHLRVRAITSWSGTATITVATSINGRGVTVVESALPAGASTSANQATEITNQGTQIARADTQIANQVLILANQATEITALQILDDVPSAMNGNFVKGDPIMGQLDDASITLATEDKVAPVRITSNRSLHTNLRDGVGAETGTSSNRLKVDAILNSTPLTVTFSVIAQAIAIGSGKSMISILNAAGSGVKLRLRDLRIVNVQTAAVTGVIADFRKFRFTGHSAGTVIVPDLHDTADVVSASVTCRTGATITGEAAIAIRRWQFSTDEWGAGAADVESAAHIDQLYQNALWIDQYMKAFTLNSGEGLHIKQLTASTVGTFDIFMVFTQE